MFGVVSFDDFDTNLIILSDNSIPDNFAFEDLYGVHPVVTLRNIERISDQGLLTPFNDVDNDDDASEDSIPSVDQRLQHWKMNVLHLCAYFFKKKRELHSLIAQEGMCTFWFTFSAADHHWVDLFRLIYGDHEASTYLGLTPI